MKRRLAMLLSAFCVLVTPVTALAADSEAWLQTEGQKDSQVVITVETAGNCADANFTVSFDAEDVSLANDGVATPDTVDVSATNAKNEGKIQFAFASEKAVEGKLLTLTFEVTGSFDAEDFAIEGTAHDVNGEVLSLESKGVTVKAVEEPSTEEPATEEPSTEEPSVEPEQPANPVVEVIVETVEKVVNFFKKLFGKRP